MRKYFLLSFAALMTVSTANATDGASNLAASATIIEPIIVECTPIDFGTLYFKDYKHPDMASAFNRLKMDSSGNISDVTDSPKVNFSLIFNSQGTPGTCTGLPEGATFTLSSNNDHLYLDGAQNIYVSNIIYSNGKLVGDLFISPKTVLDGSELTGSAVMQFTY